MDDSEETADPFFTPVFGVSADLETGMMGVEHLVTMESVDFPTDRLDDVIEQVINFAAATEAGKEYFPPSDPVIGLMMDRETGAAYLSDPITGKTLPFPSDRTNELVDQLMEFRRVYLAGGCR